MRSLLRKHRRLLLTVIALIVFALYVLPIYWMIVSGFKSPTEIYAIPPTLWPRNASFLEFWEVLKSAIPYLKSSFIIAFFATAVTLVLGATGGYGLARLKTKWTRWILLCFLIAQMLPNILRVTPLFVIFLKANLLNNYVSVILAIASFTVPFAVITLRTAFLALPTDLEEAALIDGSGRFRSFLYIVLPLVKPHLIIVSTISLIWSYGDFIFPLSFLRNRAMQPATVGLYNFIGAEVVHWNRVMAFATVTALPLMIIFMLFQRHIVQGLTVGGVDK